MIVDFDIISEESRVWIYQSNRTLSPLEIIEIEDKIKDFLISWTAHGSDLQASYRVLDRFFCKIHSGP